MEEKSQANQISEAYLTGRRTGIAISALALSIVTYLSLLGFEKAILAIVLGIIALKGAQTKSLSRRFGILSICLSVLFMVSAIVFLIIFREKVMEFIGFLKTLS
jgi:hypothetical protein